MSVAAMGLVAGCGVMASPGAMRVTSRGQERAELPLTLPTRVYDSTDANTADFYLSDLPREVWMGGADASSMTGVMVHVHMFVAPKAGRTPIETTASSATVRVLVLSNGELGVYGGGGFFSKSGTAGQKTFGGGLREGTVKLIRATAGFDDRLGPAFFSGSINAERNPDEVAAMRRAFNYLASFGTPAEAEGEADER